MRKSKSKTKKGQRKTGFWEVLPAPLLFVLAGIILVGGAVFAVWKSGQPAGGQIPIEVKGSPSLKVNQDKIDLGDVKLGKTVSVSFQLTNIGDKNLQFSDQPYVEVIEGC
jgi:hypothetical protein